MPKQTKLNSGCIKKTEWKLNELLCCFSSSVVPLYSFYISRALESSLVSVLRNQRHQLFCCEQTHCGTSPQSVIPALAGSHQRLATRPPSPAQRQESAYLEEKDREDIKSASIIFQRAADSLSQISQSLLCTVYCHRVLTLSNFNWNGEREDYPTYSAAQRFLMCLNTRRRARPIHSEPTKFLRNQERKKLRRSLITAGTEETVSDVSIFFSSSVHRAESTPQSREGWK